MEVWSVCVLHWQPGSWVSAMENDQNRLSWARWGRGGGLHPDCCVCSWINRLFVSRSVRETVGYIAADRLFYSLLAPGRLPQVESAPVSSAKSKGHEYKPDLAEGFLSNSLQRCFMSEVQLAGEPFTPRNKKKTRTSWLHKRKYSGLLIASHS